MNETITCTKCGQEFESSPALRNQCPSCLLAQALPECEQETQRYQPRFTPPEIGELAGLFPQLEIQELTGHGGMSAVYKAVQKNLGRLVAVKILPQEVAASQGGIERFQREARALAQLNHPNIVQVYDAGQAGPWCFIIMEFVAGPNLRQYLGESPLPPADVLRIASAICDGLQYAHDHGVVHRDVKPENVLLDSTGAIKLVDFGLAKLRDEQFDDAARTRTGQVMGTPYYLAPEQIESPTTVDHRADVYSLGILIYEMLTGELPFGRFVPPSQQVGSDSSLDDVVFRAMARDRRLRYQQVGELRKQLHSREPHATRPDSVQPVSAHANQAASLDGPFSLLWTRLRDLAFATGSLAAVVVGKLALIAGVAVHVDYDKFRNNDPGLHYVAAKPLAPPWLLYACAIIALVLSFGFARLCVATLKSWREFRWSQLPALPTLMLAYTLLANVILFGPGIILLLFGTTPLWMDVHSWTVLGKLFTRPDQFSALTPYWLRVYGGSLLASSVWCISMGLVILKHPKLVHGLFHPTSEQTCATIVRIFALLIIAAGIPLGIALLYMSLS
jgi:hypothetical protein